MTRITVLEGAYPARYRVHRRIHAIGREYEPPLLDVAELDGLLSFTKRAVKSVAHVSATAGRAVGHVTMTGTRAVVRSRLGKAATAAVVGAGVTAVAGPAAGAAAAGGVRKLLNNANDLLQPRKASVKLPPTVSNTEASAVSRAVKTTTTPAASNYAPLAIGGGILALIMFM